MFAFAPSAGAEVGPDVVRLKDGAFVRGTIMELDPEGTVTIQDARGQLRSFDMSEVEYAGPAQTPSDVDREPEEPEPEAAALELQLSPAEDQDLNFFRFVNRWDYEALCVGPCTVSVEPGPLRLGAGINERSPIEGELLQVQADAHVEVRYRNRQPARTAGIVTGIVGGLSFVTLFTLSFGDGFSTRTDVLGFEQELGVDEGLATAAIVVGVGAAVAALALIFQKDRLEYRYVRPDR